MMAEVSRRTLIQQALATGVVLSTQRFSNGEPTSASTAATQPDPAAQWVDTQPNGSGVGVTWGVPWQRGRLKKGDALRVETEDGRAIVAQTWPTAYWPDGSVKWSAIAVGPTVPTTGIRVSPGEPATGGPGVTVSQSGGDITVDTGPIRCVIAAEGDVLFRDVMRGNKTIGRNSRLIAISQDTPSDAEMVRRQTFAGRVDKATIEQAGPMRAVVKLTGTHATGDRQWLPFTVRCYFYAGSDVIRLVHTFIYDGEPAKDFIAGLGVRFDVPMRDAMQDRHVRFVGHEHGLFGESVRNITGLRRDPGEKIRDAQVEGKAAPASAMPDNVASRLEFIPAWGDFTLAQLSADGFSIRKRTKAGCAWIPADAGKRAAGVGYVGGVGGGVSFGVRDFWQKYPAQLDVRNAATDVADVTLWLVSPDAPAMDLRPYHDVMGMDTYDKQNEGLAITYEDYEPGYDTPYGVARTSEMQLKFEPATPSRDALVAFADVVRKPPQLLASPEQIHASGVFGPQWTRPDRSSLAKAWIEDRLNVVLDQYLKEVDQRSWYGFWDYGDVMHSYDGDRHQWRYDVGGYAWDNSELSTDLWLWHSAMRTGRGDLFRMAEAMTRHTSEVDVYHLGRFKGLGTRHGVQHWSDSSKQSRISTPIYRRAYYFLTADERTGDLLGEQMHTIEAEKKIVIGRKLKPGSPTLPLPAVEDAPTGGTVNLGGLNYGNALAAWVTQAERTGDPACHAKIIEAMKGVGELPYGFFSTGWTTNIDTGHVTDDGRGEINLSHLMACFGLPELVVELVDLYGDRAPKFAAAWAQYGRLYSGTDADRQRELGPALKKGLFKEASLRDAHSRATAFAAKQANDPSLAKRAWRELLGEKFTPQAPQLKTVRVVGPDVLNPVDEMPNIGTNGAAQWGLAAMQCLSLVGDRLDSSF